MSGSPQVSFERRDVEGDRTLFVRGELDMANANEFRAQLADAMRESHSPTVVDLSAVAFMDSTGINVLCDAHDEASSFGSELLLIAPSPPCRRVFEILGLTNHFDIRDAH